MAPDEPFGLVIIKPVNHTSPAFLKRIALLFDYLLYNFTVMM